MNDTIQNMHNAARYKRVSVRLSNRAARILSEIAEVELRTPQQQASYMLERQLRDSDVNPDTRIPHIITPIAEEL